jgi:hypothetical protein
MSPAAAGESALSRRCELEVEVRDSAAGRAVAGCCRRDALHAPPKGVVGCVDGIEQHRSVEALERGHEEGSVSLELRELEGRTHLAYHGLHQVAGESRRVIGLRVGHVGGIAGQVCQQHADPFQAGGGRHSSRSSRSLRRRSSAASPRRAGTLDPVAGHRSHSVRRSLPPLVRKPRPLSDSNVKRESSGSP